MDIAAAASMVEAVVASTVVAAADAGNSGF